MKSGRSLRKKRRSFTRNWEELKKKGEELHKKVGGA